MNKITDLVKMSAAIAEIPKEVSIKGHDVESELLLVNEILNPVIHITAQLLHARSLGGVLVELDGCIRKAEKKPFGLILEGDIDESTASLPLGVLVGFYIEAFRLIKPLIENDSLEDLSLAWTGSFFSDVSDGDKVSLKQLLDKPMLDVIYSLS